MKTALASIRCIGPCLVVAGAAQYAVFDIHPNDYEDGTLWFLMSSWVVGMLVMSFFEHRLHKCTD